MVKVRKIANVHKKNFLSVKIVNLSLFLIILIVNTFTFYVVFAIEKYIYSKQTLSREK